MATTVTPDGVSIAFTDHGGNGPDLLLAHATGFCAGVWGPMIEPLQERYRVVSFDERGHGASGEAPEGIYAWDGFATDALAVIDALGLETPYGAGHSCGGALLLLAEMRRPTTFRAIWAFEPIVFPFDHPMTNPTPNGNRLANGARKRRATFASREEARANYASKPPLGWLDPRVLDGYIQCGLRDLPDGTVTLSCAPENEARTYEMGGSHGAYARLYEVLCPVAMACGETTDAIGPTVLPLLAERLPNATTAVWEGHGHFGCLVDPDRTVASIFAAFDEVQVIDLGIAVALVAVAIAAGGQAITAIGFSLVAVPFVSIAVGPDAAVPTINIVAGVLNLIMLISEREHAMWRDALRLFVPAAIVIPFVAYGIENLPTDTLSIINGVTILAAVALLATGARAHSLKGRRGAVLAGAIAGAGNVATSVGGPTVAMYAINAEWPAKNYRPTLQAFFLGINIVSVAARGVPRLEHPGLLAALVAVTLIGWSIGRHYAKRVDDAFVRQLLLITAAAGGFVAMVRGTF